jgi:reactive intermediate/imine deaminase
VAGEREEIRVDGLSEPISHYTDAVRFGDVLFVSGVAPFDGDGNVVGAGDVVAQARQIHENLRAVLDVAGAGFEDILKVTVFMIDVHDRAAINSVRKEYFGDARPASTLIGVSALADPDMLIEIEAIVGLPRHTAADAQAHARSASSISA